MISELLKISIRLNIREKVLIHPRKKNEMLLFKQKKSFNNLKTNNLRNNARKIVNLFFSKKKKKHNLREKLF